MSRTTNMLLARIFTGIILAGFYMTLNTAFAATPTPKFAADGMPAQTKQVNGLTYIQDNSLIWFKQKGDTYEYVKDQDSIWNAKEDPKPAKQIKSDKSGTASQKSAEQHITKSTLYKDVELNNLDQAKRLITYDYGNDIFDLSTCVKKSNVLIGGKTQDTLTCDKKNKDSKIQKIQFEFDDLSEKKNALNETVYQKLQKYLCKRVDKNLTYEDNTCMEDLETIWGSNVPRKPSKGKYPKSVDVKNIPVTKAGAKEYVENYQKTKDMNLTDCKTNVEEHNVVCSTPDKTEMTFNFDKEFIDLDYFAEKTADSPEVAAFMVQTVYKDCKTVISGTDRPNIVTCKMLGGKNNKQKFEFEFEFKKIEQPEDESEEAEEDEEEEETLETPEESVPKSDTEEDEEDDDDEEDEKENEQQQNVDTEKILAQMEADAHKIRNAYDKKMDELIKKYNH